MGEILVGSRDSSQQNIAEGSRAGATSSQTELRLLNVARSSLEELLLDYEDYLRHRRLPWWAPAGPEARAVRRVPQMFRRDRTDRRAGETVLGVHRLPGLPRAGGHMIRVRDHPWLYCVGR